MQQICSEDLKKRIQTDNVYLYIVKLPPGINEAVTPCSDGYTVYIDIDLPDNRFEETIRHVLWHIENSDFESNDIQSIETKAHNMVTTMMYS